jgi:methyl-accepting chemotaxis protein
MNMNFTIRGKLIAGFTLILLLSGGFGLAALSQINALNDLQQDSSAKIARLNRVDAALWEIRFGFPSYTATLDPKKKQSVKDNDPIQSRLILDNLRQFSESQSTTPHERALATQTSEALSTFMTRRPEVFALWDAGHNEEAQLLREGTVQGLASAVSQGLKDLRAQTESHNQETIAAARLSAYRMLSIAGVLVVLLNLAVAHYLYQSITRPLASLMNTVAHAQRGEELQEEEGIRSDDEIGGVRHAVHGLLVERREALRKAEAESEQLNRSVVSILQAVHQMSQKDLTARAPVTSDVVGTVSDSINTLTEETSKVLQDVSQIAGHVVAASDKVRSQAAMVSKTAEDERLGVSKMLGSLTLATQIMNQMAALTENSNHSANKATEITDTALQTVNGTVRGMDSIRETIVETENRLKRLGERSQEISGVVSLINAIAERTHSLALNASISASVAGEAGKGFAVVADEVKRLAESARAATQQIATLVNNIQIETHETISTMNRTISQVAQGSKLAQKAGEQMRMTQQITNDLVTQVQRIAEVSEQQRAMSADLLSAVETIGQSTERTADQISTQNQETESLMHSARRLVESVNVFKLPAIAAA